MKAFHFDIIQACREWLAPLVLDNIDVESVSSSLPDVADTQPGKIGLDWAEKCPGMSRLLTAEQLEEVNKTRGLRGIYIFIC